ncbi:MAG: hypothetical protein WC043_00030 [Pseudobdellovibrionaceae bacterium]
MDTQANIPAMVLDPTLWVLASFVLFIALAYIFGRKAAVGVLDQKIEKIRSDIELAAKLKDEAQNLVNQYKNDINNATHNAEAIIATAKAQADLIRQKGESEIAETLARRENMLKMRIAQMEQSAIDDIRRYAAELAISATTEIIAQNMTPQKKSDLASQSIQNLKEQIN